MKYLKYGIIPLLLVGVSLLYLTVWTPSDAQNSPPSSNATPATITVKVQENPSIPSVQRIGLNTSFWTTYGAEQYMRNILMNPGFEGRVERILVIVQATNDNSFSDGSGLGQADDFWKGATYDVRSGQSAGMKGKISQSKQTGAGGLPQYFVDGTVPSLAQNDVVILTKTSNPNPVEQWWIPDESLDLVKVDSSNPRPGSDGKNVLVLSPKQNKAAGINFYLDMLYEKYGKLLQCKGKWRISFWARSDDPKASLSFSFARIAPIPRFVGQTIHPTAQWQQYEVDFSPNDTGPVGPLQLNIAAAEPNTKVYIDDIFLGPIQSDNPTTAWNQDVIDIVKALRPSYIRDWQGQLGDTFKNRIASQFARITHVERLYGGDGNKNFSFSIPDVLDLCKQVQANPWLIIPTSLSDDELTAFGQYLALNADKNQFSEVIVEFGNENWNWLFRSLAIPVAEAHGPVAERAFQFLSAAAGPNVNLRKVINGQFVNPWLCNEYVKLSPSSDTLAVAPYFFREMQANTADKDNAKALFAVEDNYFRQLNQDLKKTKKNLAVYEVNMHTTGGTATTPERLRFVSGAISGAALAKHLLTNMFYNASPQCVFCLAQISMGTYDVPASVDLWGIVHDVSPTKRMRPTGLAMKMLNNIISGSLHKIVPQQPEKAPLPDEANNLTLASFRTADGWSAALVSANDKPVTLAVQFPDDQRALPQWSKSLDAKSPFDNNEVNEEVKIVKRAVQADKRTVTVTVPPYGFVILGSDINPTAELEPNAFSLEPEIIHQR